MTHRERAPSANTAVPREIDWPALVGVMITEYSGSCQDPPCVPGPVAQIHTALQGRTPADEEFRRQAKRERCLARLVLLLANAALRGTGTKRVTGVDEALAQLGRPLIMGSSMAFAIRHMKDQLSLRSIAAPLIELWRSSLTIACISHVVVRRTQLKVADAFFLGLLHGIGYFYIMARSVGRSGALGVDFLGLESIVQLHPALGRVILKAWGASEEFALAVNHQHGRPRGARRPESADLTDVLIASVRLSSVLRQAEPRDLSFTTDESFGRLAMAEPDCAKALQHTEHQLAALQELLEG